MKFKVNLTVDGFVEVEADTKEGAERIVSEEGFSMSDFVYEFDVVDSVEVAWILK